uniref:Uncharacterized protein n=1 Tax=Guillardia theta TaxID=55529 RepID=A0A7S4K4R7_GUITH|mmetsp:Transcript_21060/g.70188  ORF Transcript_21060/g.70188 Transcript_21060/m.70188 type:complete len:227 (+) Transcript_21060:273-953(+)
MLCRLLLTPPFPLVSLTKSGKMYPLPFHEDSVVFESIQMTCRDSSASFLDKEIKGDMDNTASSNSTREGMSKGIKKGVKGSKKITSSRSSGVQESEMENKAMSSWERAEQRFLEQAIQASMREAESNEPSFPAKIRVIFASRYENDNKVYFEYNNKYSDMEIQIEEGTTAEEAINMIRQSAQLKKKLRLRIACQERFLPPMAILSLDGVRKGSVIFCIMESKVNQF